MTLLSVFQGATCGLAVCISLFAVRTGQTVDRLMAGLAVMLAVITLHVK